MPAAAGAPDASQWTSAQCSSPRGSHVRAVGSAAASAPSLFPGIGASPPCAPPGPAARHQASPPLL
eukprot:11465773-Prorocentrum_lima.AAC.1